MIAATFAEQATGLLAGAAAVLLLRWIDRKHPPSPPVRAVCPSCHRTPQMANGRHRDVIPRPDNPPPSGGIQEGENC